MKKWILPVMALIGTQMFMESCKDAGKKEQPAEVKEFNVEA